MEASVAAETPEETTPEPTLADINSSLKQFGSDIEQMRDHLAAEPWKPAEGAPVEEDEPVTGLDFLQPQQQFEQQQPSQEEILKQLQTFVRSEAQKVAKDEIGPVQQELKQERQERQLVELSDRYPQLQDEKVASELLDLVAKVVDKEGFPDDMKTHPGFIEQTYLAARARAQSQDGGADAAAAALEGAGGASPGGAGQGAAQATAQDWAQSVAPKRHALFTGG